MSEINTAEIRGGVSASITLLEAVIRELRELIRVKLGNSGVRVCMERMCMYGPVKKGNGTSGVRSIVCKDCSEAKFVLFRDRVPDGETMVQIELLAQNAEHLKTLCASQPFMSQVKEELEL